MLPGHIDWLPHHCLILGRSPPQLAGGRDRRILRRDRANGENAACFAHALGRRWRSSNWNEPRLASDVAGVTGSPVPRQLKASGCLDKKRLTIMIWPW
jgi:hypothetical protein